MDGAFYSTSRNLLSEWGSERLRGQSSNLSPHKHPTIVISLYHAPLVHDQRVTLVLKGDQRTRLEIIDQPESLRKTIDSERKKIERIADKITKGQFSKVCIIAMGSSYSAALTARTSATIATSLPVEIYRGYELEFERLLKLGRESCVYTQKGIANTSE